MEPGGDRDDTSSGGQSGGSPVRMSSERDFNSTLDTFITTSRIGKVSPSLGPASLIDGGQLGHSKSALHPSHTSGALPNPSLTLDDPMVSATVRPLFPLS